MRSNQLADIGFGYFAGPLRPSGPNTAKLKIGVHRLVAKITMALVAGGAKPVVVTRALMVVRCSSPVVAPRFTG